MKDIDVAALDSLAALADHGSFDRAAQHLSLTQSAVSQRLRVLESQVGQPLVVRSRPLQLTEPGKVLLRYARQLQAMRADAARELGAEGGTGERLPIAVNADSLATWVLPALDHLVRGGVSLELLVDDQDFTHDSLRQGAVLGCVSTVSQALRGCRVTPLGTMRYFAVVSPSFLREHLPRGLNRGNFTQVPFLIFNRKDDMQQQWAAKAFGVASPRLHERFVPSSEAYVRAAQMGWGVGVVPALQVTQALANGSLVQIMPSVTLAVALHWHQWKLGPDDATPSRRVGLLDQIGAALAAGARDALEPP